MKPSPPGEPVEAAATDDIVRIRLLHLFRSSVRQGRVHPLLPLVLKYRAGQRRAPGAGQGRT